MSDAALLLGVDTSRDGDLVLAGLSPGGGLTLLAQQQFTSREQSAELLPHLTRLLATADATLHQLTAIIVVHGPGTFTGLRIGLAAVKGLAHAINIPVIAVSSLAVLASLGTQATASVLAAGRSEYYVRTAGQDGSAVESLQSEKDLAALLGNAPVIAADKALADRLSLNIRNVSFGQFGAMDAIRAALPRLHAKDFEDLATLDANYVRRPYTERPLGPPITSGPSASR